MKLFAIVSLVALLGCSASAESSTASDDATEGRASTASGYDLDGPKVAATDNVPAEFCATVVSDVQSACTKAGGKVSRVNGCGDLCSTPIARAGKTAGYGFGGYAQIANDLEPVACITVVPDEWEACDRAGGKRIDAGSCETLCTVPIAERGKVAGFDREGFKILDAPPALELCPAVGSDIVVRCSRAGGKTTSAAGCVDLCSLPL